MTNEIDLNAALLLSAVLFVLGLVGVLIRRNILIMLISVEIMLNAAGMAFVIASAKWHQPDGQIMYLFILAMTAAEVSVALALVLQMNHQHKTLDIDSISEMKG
jgi:NADH-quinone oxidoreductase subunit K